MRCGEVSRPETDNSAPESKTRLRSDIHCKYSIFIVHVTYAIDFEHSQWISERTFSWVGLSSVKRGLSSGSRDLVAVTDVICCDAHRVAMFFFVQFGSLLFGVFFLVLFVSLTDSFSYENLPAVAMDYKVHIDAGKEDCYFQYVNPGATFYVSFQVLSTGYPREFRMINNWTWVSECDSLDWPYGCIKLEKTLSLSGCLSSWLGEKQFTIAYTSHACLQTLLYFICLAVKNNYLIESIWLSSHLFCRRCMFVIL